MSEAKSNTLYLNARMITTHSWQLAWKQMVQQKPAFMKKGQSENKEQLWQLKLSCIAS